MKRFSTYKIYNNSWLRLEDYADTNLEELLGYFSNDDEEIETQEAA